MNTEIQIKHYLDGLPDPKRIDMLELHRSTLEQFPAVKLWFMDGKNDEGKVVANPNIGYGSHTIKGAKGKTIEWFQVGISANTTGISVYILGIKDKAYLNQTFGK